MEGDGDCSGAGATFTLAVIAVVTAVLSWLNDLTIIERKLQEIRDENRKFAARLIAAALTAAAIGGLSGYKLGSMPPQQIIIQQPAAK